MSDRAALELFFELHKLKKDGDALAEKKIKDYLDSISVDGYVEEHVETTIVTICWSV